MLCISSANKILVKSENKLKKIDKILILSKTMDRYRSLYKENASMLTPSQHNRANRELQNANRAKSRRQIFQSARNIGVSPTPRKHPRLEEENAAQIEEKENSQVVKIDNALNGGESPKSSNENDGNKSRIALVATGKVDAKKATKQEAFLLRFIEWKEAHKRKEQKKNEPKRRPFVSSVGVGGNTFGSSTRTPAVVSSNAKNKEGSTFVPKDHTKFRPPAGLQNPLADMAAAARDICENGRKSFYSVLPTPPRKNTAKNSTNTPAVGAIKSMTGAIPKTTTKPTAVVEPCKKTIAPVQKYSATSKTVATPACGAHKTNAKIITNSGARGPIKNNNGIIKKSATTDLVNRLNSAQKFTRPQPPKKAPETTVARKPTAASKNLRTSANVVTKQKPAAAGITTGAVGKAHLLKTKQAASAAAFVKQPNTQRNAKLATNFKAKKAQVSTFSRPNAPSKITIKSKKLLGGGLRTCKTDAAFAIAETPTDLLNINPYEPFITSTRLKSLSPHTTNTPHISPINKEGGVISKNGASNQNVRTTHSSTSAKRTLLTNEVKPSIQSRPTQLQRQKSKFNFIRYSVGLSELDTSAEIEPTDEKSADEEKQEMDGLKSAQQITVLEVNPQATNTEAMPPRSSTASEKTPTANESERPANYVGSFVSVSRGKVSARKEREKRDSIYVPSGDVTLLATSTNTPIKVRNEEIICQSTIATPVSVEARRMLEAVRYFRQQLNSEIERLHALCDQWDEYKLQNLALLQKTGGEDMINVTIGQARLLTSKKFQQFRGLIERCESGARGTAAVSDGSEDTKPVTDVDLEGFWSMLNLQVDNVEKRFENLTRWKSNDWVDPEDIPQITTQIKPKAKPNLTKVKKAKAPAKTAKASSGLQAMLRKMHAEMRKNKENAVTTDTNGTDEVALILTPKHQQRQRRSHSGTPKTDNNADTQRNSTPRRVSVVVRDRKSLSAAATVISLPADSAVVSAVAAQRRLSRLAAAAATSESPKSSLKSCGDELRRSLSNMEKAFNNCNDLLRTTLSGNANKARRRSGTPNFIESPLDAEVKEQPQQQQISTPPPASVSRKSILKTPGTAKGKLKNVIFSEKLRVKKFKFTMEDDEKLSDEEEVQMQTSTEELLNDQRTYSLRTRKVVLRPSSEFEIPKA